VKLSVLSKTGEAVVAILARETSSAKDALAGQPVRMGSATAITPSVILLVAKENGAALVQTAQDVGLVHSTCWRATSGSKKT
jgi:hypothetical protein